MIKEVYKNVCRTLVFKKGDFFVNEGTNILSKRN